MSAVAERRFVFRRSHLVVDLFSEGTTDVFSVLVLDELVHINQLTRIQNRTTDGAEVGLFDCR